ncbi:MAG: lamin tail domain-containing protein [Thermoanaerobaculaceae bacterium]|nr:lamin tail domain-containing protein [Thermoanaerobaculaceae bacterium]
MRHSPPVRPRSLSLVPTLLLALGLGGIPATASVAPDDNHPFAIFVGSDGYRFSPALPGKLGTERLYAIISHPDAAARQALGPMLWTLELRGPDGAGSVVRTAGGKAWPDEVGSALVEFHWDGRTDRGDLAPAGLYTFTFGARLVPMAAVKGRPIETYEDAGGIPEAEEADPTTDEVVVDPTLTVEDSLNLRASRAMGVCDTPQNTPLEAGFGYNFYYGSNHSHSNYSDGGHPTSSCSTGVGTGTFDPAAVYDYARTTGGVDFWVISDHNHLFDDAVSASNPPVTEAKVLQRYQDGRAAATAATVDGAFVAVWAQEFGVISNGGHVLTYETPGLFGWETCSDCNSVTPQCTPGTNCYFDWYVPKLTHYLTLYAQSVAHPSPAGPLGSLAHPQSGDYDNYAFDANADDAMQGIAVRSGLASSSSTSCLDANVGSTNYFSRWMTALNKGFHLGPTAEQDAHCNNYGVANPTRTVYLLPNGTAPVLTKTAILAAHRTRHFFATEDTNAQIIFATGDSSHIMGDIFTVPTSVTLRAAAFDPGGDAVSTIELWRGQIGAGVPTTAYQTVSNQSTFITTDSPTPGTYYYFIHAVQQDGHDIYTAPMWITFTGAPPCTTPPDLAGVPTATDVAACADSGVTVAWTDIGDWGDAGSSGSRSIEVLRSTNGSTWTSCGVDADLTSPFVDTGGSNGTSYLYRVRATNRCGAVAQIGTTTPTADVVSGPVFAGVQSVTDVSVCQLSGVQVQWQAPSSWNDGCASSCVRTFVVYRDGSPVSPALGASSTSYLDVTVPAGSHSYRVEATSHTGCANDGGVALAGSDATNDGSAPTITLGPATTPAVNSVTIAWTTNEASDSRVEYGLTATYGSTASSPALVTAHSVTITGLTAATPYHVRVGSADGCGNGPTWSPDGTFTTLATPVGLDISGWKLVQHSPPSTTRTYTFPAGTLIAPGEYVVVGRNASQAAFETFWATQTPGFALPANAHYLNGGDKLVVNDNDDSIELQNASSAIVDGVTPALPAANSSIKRTSPAEPATVITSWSQSTWTTANPGSGQSPAGTTNLVLNEVADAIGTGNYIYEFVELYYDTVAPTTPRLIVTRTGTGAGTVASDPEGIDCGMVCEADFTFDTPVQLAASPDPGSTFAGWGGACSGTGTCTVTMDAARSVTATFTLIPALVLSASAAPTTGAVPLGVVFTASAGGGVPGYTWAWDFGDSQGSTAQNPSHTYTTVGTYTVTCTVADSTLVTASKSLTIHAHTIATAVSLTVDVHQIGALGSDLNGVLEPGETVVVEPMWRNYGDSAFTLTGIASAFTGPGAANLVIADASVNYGLIGAGSASDCFTTTGDCLALRVMTPASRPQLHWDATATETPSSGQPTTWKLHIGDSFVDTPRDQWAYRFIETLLHNGVTTGIDPAKRLYGPGGTVLRDQMAVFIARALAGGDANVPVAGTVTGKGSYDCRADGVSLFNDVAPTDWFCRHVHLLLGQGITTGCDPANALYCPAPPVTRGPMAVFIARAVAGSEASVPLAYADAGTGRAYSCDPRSPSTFFVDVSAGDWYCKHVHYLWATGVISGCDQTNHLYCPVPEVPRDQMAKFLTNGFGLKLY